MKNIILFFILIILCSLCSLFHLMNEIKHRHITQNPYPCLKNHKVLKIIQKYGKQIKIICEKNLQDLKEDFWDCKYSGICIPKYHYVIIELSGKVITLIPNIEQTKYVIFATGDNILKLINKIEYYETNYLINTK